MNYRSFSLYAFYSALIALGASFSWEIAFGLAVLLVSLHSLVGFLKKQATVYGEDSLEDYDSQGERDDFDNQYGNHELVPPTGKRFITLAELEKAHAEKNAPKNNGKIPGLDSKIFDQFKKSALADIVMTDDEDTTETTPAKLSTTKSAAAKPDQTMPGFLGKANAADIEKMVANAKEMRKVAESRQANAITDATADAKKSPPKKEFKTLLNEQQEMSATAKPKAQGTETQTANTTSNAKPLAVTAKKPTSYGPQTNIPRNHKKVDKGLDLMVASDEEESQDLFDDVKISLTGDQKAKEIAKTSPRSPSQDWVDEGLGQTLNQNVSKEDRQSEAQTLLKMAQNSFGAHHYDEAKVLLDNYFSILKDLGLAPAWDILYLFAKILVLNGELSQALSLFTDIMQKHLNPQHSDYAKTLEEISQLLENKQKNAEALPFRFDLLNHYRNRSDRPSMDRTYERIEQILEISNEDERLIKIYQNHLEIKRVLKDRSGESRLLDLIGKRYHKMGRNDLSRQFYEDHLKLKSSLESLESLR